VPVLIRELAGVLLLAILALIAGLTLNRFRSDPLPLIYQPPEQRFAAQLTALVGAPPFEQSSVASISLNDLRLMVQAKNALILDARSSVSYQQGHIPGALNLARDDFAADYQRLSSVLDANHHRPIIVYCSGGACNDSRLVAAALITLGFDDVKVFTGGWDAWSASGSPTITGQH
jgi:rhodanese-related sulfurtransferase